MAGYLMKLGALIESLEFELELIEPEHPCIEILMTKMTTSMADWIRASGKERSTGLNVEER